jgi:transposase
LEKEATKAPVVPDDDDPGAATLIAFQEAITKAVTDGAVSADAQERIEKRLEKLREAVAERDDVPKAVADLRKEIRNAKGIDRPIRAALLEQLEDFDDR